jgi:hypothetical protein
MIFLGRQAYFVQATILLQKAGADDAKHDLGSPLGFLTSDQKWELMHQDLPDSNE